MLVGLDCTILLFYLFAFMLFILHGSIPLGQLDIFISRYFVTVAMSSWSSNFSFFPDLL